MNSIIDLIGNTPLVKLNNLNPNSRVSVFAKLEGQNPGGSVKDRTAYGLISHALKHGMLKRGNTIVEATSGNTGIAIAMIAREYGVKVKLVMPDNATEERITTMKAYGAEIILTPAEKTIEYSRELALEMSEKDGYHILNQFDNPANPQVHIDTTGPEIWKDTKGQITHFVSSMGTTGTIIGTSKYLKPQNPKIQIIGAQPTEGSRIPGIRRWSPEFLPGIYEEEWVDRKMDVSTEEAIGCARELARKEGVMGGMSTGGAGFIALKIAKEIEEGVIVFIACDRGDRYLSSDLYEKI